MPTRKLPDRTKANARGLRTESTDAERILWFNLRRHALAGFKFHRQHPFGPYILDFHCAAAKLVVELDGGQHLEAEGQLRDARRTAYLEKQGLRGLRFDNRQAILETHGVLDVIREALGDPSP